MTLMDANVGAVASYGDDYYPAQVADELRDINNAMQMKSILLPKFKLSCACHFRRVLHFPGCDCILVVALLPV